MAYGTPTDPVAGTVITVAYAVANLLDPIRWLRQLTGNADPPASNRVVVSSSTSSTAWGQVPTDAIADLAVTTAKINDLAITNAKIAANTISGDAKLAPSSVTGNSGSSAIGANTIHANRIVATSFDATQVDSAFSIDSVTIANAAKIIQDSAIVTALIADNAVTAAKLASGTAVTNLGFTPSRIISGTYSGTGSSSGRQVTTGFSVKLVVIHESSADTMYIAVGTTNSLRLAPSSVQGSSSVHTHASDGFVVGDGSVQGNVSGSDNYRYTAFG